MGTSRGPSDNLVQCYSKVPRGLFWKPANFLFPLFFVILLSMNKACDALSTQTSATRPTFSELANRCITQWEERKGSLRNEQLFVGVAGGPGSGKTTTCSCVANEIQRKRDDLKVVVIPMDGFHYHTIELERIARETGVTLDDLMLQRGAPSTFDADSLVRAMQSARERGEASLPIYDRSISNPVPDGVKIMRDTNIVLVEGNYLLAFAEPAWAPLKDIFDDTWFVECETPEKQKSRLVKRHLLNWTQRKVDLWGDGEPGARKKVENLDWKNVVWITERSRKEANLIVNT